MLDFGFWYDIAVYGNTAWNGSFTPKEIARNAYYYLCEWEASVGKGELTFIMSELLKLLTEDNSEESMDFLEEIRKEHERLCVL